MKDEVVNGLDLVENHVVYHMYDASYKSYTLHKTL